MKLRKPGWNPVQARAIARLPGVYAKRWDRARMPGEGQPDASAAAGLLGALLEPAGSILAGNESVQATADLALCDGRTLDLYGAMLNQPRGALDDRAYRYVLRIAVARNFIDGTHESVLQGLMRVFGVDRNEVLLYDHPAASGVVKLDRLPFKTVNEAGLTTGQAVALIRRLLPLGVGLEAESFEGTFAFGAGEEYDEAAGFALSEQDQSIGGWLGATMGDSEAPVLPF